MQIQFGHQRLPVLRTSQIIVVGGSLAGLSSALTLAQAGRRVLLLEPRTYLGREISATLRPWVHVDRFPVTGLMAQFLDAESITWKASPTAELALPLDRFKVFLEDALLAAGVDLLYATVPVDLLVEAGQLQGLVVGNKSGRQLILGEQIIDATETALIARLAGATFASEAALGHYSRTLAFDQVKPLGVSQLDVPVDLGLVGNVVHLHSAHQNPSHVYVECEFILPTNQTGLAALMERELEARQRSLRLASYLTHHVPQFNNPHQVRLAFSSYELHGRHTPQFADPAPIWAQSLVHKTCLLPQLNAASLQWPIVAFAATPPNVWCVQEAARIDEPDASLLRDPLAAGLLGTALAQYLVAGPLPAHAREFTSPTLPAAEADPDQTKLVILELASPQRGWPYSTQPAPATRVTFTRSGDVLVVGGGTSGATAATVAASTGANTILLELNPGLGGTGTFGGVDSYWAGRRVAFAARVQEAVDEVHDEINIPRRKNVWNNEAKRHALLRQAKRAGVEMYFNVIVLGTLVEGQSVRGVVVATRYGPQAFLGQAVVDATGDGDVAAFAGADYVYGSERDHIVMWYAVAQHRASGRTDNNFTSMVDVSNIEDYTRALLAGRRRGKSVYEHGIYVASRETRHILGDVVLNLSDILLKRCWPDVINIHFSNYDIKGKSASDWLLLGLIPPNLEVEVPYRCLLPKRLEHVLIAGKAISGTHDALPGIRMQADIENLGGVTGLAAALSVQNKVSPRQLDVRVLQERLVAEGLLPPSILTRSLRPHVLSDEQLGQMITDLKGDRPLHAYSDTRLDVVFRDELPVVDICVAGSRVVPILEKAHAAAAGNRRVLLAQLLAMCGSNAGVPTLMAAIQEVLAREELPPREEYIRNSDLMPPDQGAMPAVAYLIYTLGMARDPRSLEIWRQVADLLDFNEADMRDYYKAPFFYVDAVAYGAERLADPAAIPSLLQMHAHPLLNNRVCRTGFQPDYLQERQAMMELALGRALARCGARAGYTILISYLEDNRALLAEQAHTELVAITGQDHGKDPAEWIKWVEIAGDSLPIRPVLGKLDMPAADDLILREK